MNFCAFIPEQWRAFNLRKQLCLTLTGLDYHINIPSDFLGGKPACLRTLQLGSVQLPLACPVLSTVTSVTLDGPADLQSAVSFSRLFELFPSVRTLHLKELREAFAKFLPRGPAPASLEPLTLMGVDSGYDVTPHYSDWRTDGLRDVSLQQEASSAACIDQLLSGARSRTLSTNFYLDSTDIIVHCPGGRRHSISFTDEEDIAHTAELVLSASSALQDVCAMEVPLGALKEFSDVCAALFALTDLTIPIVAEKPHPLNDATHTFYWDLLRDLGRVEQSCPHVDTITLAVQCPSIRCPPSLKDAHDLLEHLSELEGCGLSPGCP
ncbi:hypothetical protein AURDEDRAFT_171203 [Auricularia subglabra TFB-10046 SS5]|uniref:Uncharacterized protein n=1 Tax=Auricularia subglabra (strain TFB-10046 / SS5) TaxID=717982 RepID=J0DCC4_AURST|nr:hypothetical protein AURDEDRAFT_171203 [Auricularia subglabra TFB-10046 SS5]